MEFPPVVVVSGGDMSIGQLEDGLRRMKDGDFTVRLDPSALHDPSLVPLFSLFNQCADRNYSFFKIFHLFHDNIVEGKVGRLDFSTEDVQGMWLTQLQKLTTIETRYTNQIQIFGEVITAVALGDFSKKISMDMKGASLELKDNINTMVDHLSTFAAETTRVALEVGTEGKLGGQAQVKGVSGCWKDLLDNVNTMASNLTSHIRAIDNVTTAVANGDLSRKITLDVQGEMLELKNTINTMVDQLNSFASEVNHLAYEVGTEGRLGGMATVPGVAGMWKDMTDNVNTMSANITSQIRNIDDVITCVALGDFSKRVKIDQKYVGGEIGELANTINTMAEQLGLFSAEVTPIIQEIGQNTKTGLKVDVSGAEGAWRVLVDALNNSCVSLNA